MSGALLALLAGPLLAAAALVAATPAPRAVAYLRARPRAGGFDRVRPPRASAPEFLLHWLTPAGLAAATAGAVALVVRASREGAFGVSGFEVDLWRAGLVLGSTLTAVVVLTARPGEERVEPVALAATVAGAGALLAAELASTGGFLVATTIALGVVAFGSASAPLARAVPLLAASDLAAIAGFVLLAQDGMRVPIEARGAGAALLVVAAVLRLLSCAGRDLATAETAGVAILAGAARAQAFLLCGWVGLGGEGAATAMATVAALLAAWFAARAARGGSGLDALTSHGFLVLVALGAGTPASVRGAVLLAAGTLLAGVLHVAGDEGGAATPSLGAAPLGATLPGVALVGSAVLERALDDRSMAYAGLAALAAMAWLAVAGVAGVRASGRRAHLPWLVLPFAAVGVFAFAPGRAFDGFAAAAARAVSPIRSVAPAVPAVGDDLGVIFAVAAAAIVFLGVGTTDPRRPALTRPPPQGPVDLRTAAVISALSAGWLGALLWVGIRRGFL